MRAFDFSRLIVAAAFFALVFTISPAHSQCPPGAETQEDHCLDPPVPPDALDVHPPEIEAVEEAIDSLIERGLNPFRGDCSQTQSPGNPVACNPDCGAGLIVEEIVRLQLIPGAGLLDKNYGFGCNNHGFDQLVFEDGYIFDVIISAGGANIPAWQALCCGPPVGEGGDGTCVDRRLEKPY
jgi:hypothetical protein